MKVQLSYDLPWKAKTDLLVVILDKDICLHDLGRSPLAEIVDRARKGFKAHRLTWSCSPHRSIPHTTSGRT